MQPLLLEQFIQNQISLFAKS